MACTDSFHMPNMTCDNWRNIIRTYRLGFRDEYAQNLVGNRRFGGETSKHPLNLRLTLTGSFPIINRTCDNWRNVLNLLILWTYTCVIIFITCSNILSEMALTYINKHRWFCVFLGPILIFFFLFFGDNFTAWTCRDFFVYGEEIVLLYRSNNIFCRL